MTSSKKPSQIATLNEHGHWMVGTVVEPLPSLQEALDPSPSKAKQTLKPRLGGWPLAGRVLHPRQSLRLLVQRGRPPGGAATAGAGGSSPPGKEKKGKGRANSHGKNPKKLRPEVDILSPDAMLNLYYIAHNVADCLYLRGFPWPGTPKGKKGKNKI
ncbi:small lysine-rich protein 1 [Nannospalax galili]|uniref:small lysine-rich protein 1 n=1 Tax=Nannospalax galili TaxID=1026970 RepID=UPI000819E4A2|nr:small lysine-rich protein 1 [Nannospalax galili]